MKDISKQLIDAVFDNEPEKVKKALEEGADPNVTTSSKHPVLSRAAYNDNLEMVQMLVEAGADVNAKSESTGSYPIHYAIANDNSKMVQYLIKHGANPNVTDEYGDTPLHFICDNYNDYEEENLELVKLLIEHNANPNLANKNNIYPLISAIERRNNKIAKYLIEHGADIHVQDEYGRQPLHWALMNANAEIANHLIDKGADLYYIDENGYTPLTIAVYEMLHEKPENKKVVSYILEKIDLDKLVKADKEFESKDDILIYFVHYGLLDFVKYLIEERGMNPFIINEDNRNLLHISADGNHYEEDDKVTKYLIEKGLDVNARDNWGNTPLMLAAEHAHYPKSHESAKILMNLIKNLVEAGADVNLKNNKGETALMKAAINFFDSKDKNEVSVTLDLLAYLVEKGADINAQDNEGNTALHLAIKNKKYPVVKKLYELGADKTIKNNKKKTPCTMTKSKEVIKILNCK